VTLKTGWGVKKLFFFFVRNLQPPASLLQRSSNFKKTIMEKFMLIFHGCPDVTPSPEQMQASMTEWMAWIDKLARDGRYVSGEPLMTGGKLIKGNIKGVTDGPYAEGKEVVGGYFIINAENYDEAVALCADYPDFDKDGSIQVRQVMKMDM